MKFKYTTMATAIAFAFSTGAAIAQTMQDEDIRTELGNHAFDNKESTITQDGSENEATTMQTGNGGGTLGAYSEVKQTGNENLSEVTQDSHITYSRVRQEGNSHVADINQSGSANQYTFSWVDQYQGDSNTATVTQIQSASTGSIIVQSGSDNDATVNQQSHPYTTEFNESHIYQTGDLNISNVNQTNAKASFSDIFQVGDENNADVTQENAPGSDSDILQVGSLNEAIVIQRDGSGSISEIIQNGDGHYAKATQLDNIQTSTINQSGGAAITTHHQSGGSSNRATTIQN